MPAPTGISFLRTLLAGVKTVAFGGSPVTTPTTGTTPPGLNFVSGASGAYNPVTGNLDVTVTAVAAAGQNPATLSNGLNSNIATGGQPTVRLSGPTGAFSVGGFQLPGGATPTAGQTINISYVGSQQLTVVNGDVSSAAVARIATPGGTPYVIPAGARFSLVFDGSLSMWALMPVSVRPRVFDVRDFGADASVADNSVPINAAAAAAAAVGGRLFMPDGATYPIENQVVIACHCEARGATLQTAGGLNSGACVAVLVGGSSVTQFLEMRLPVVIDGSNLVPAGAWTSGRVGVECRNLQDCDVHLGDVWNFAIGVHVTGAGFGNQNNRYYLRALVNNQVQVQLEATATGGWSNENSFYGGDFDYAIATPSKNITGVTNANPAHVTVTAHGYTTGDGTLIAGTGTSLDGASYRLTVIDANTFSVPAASGGTSSAGTSTRVTWAGTRQVNLVQAFLGCDGNTFLKCDFEGDVPEYHALCQGADNLFLHCRWETTNTVPKVDFDGTAAARNTILYGYEADQIIVTSSNSAPASNSIIGPQTQRIQGGPSANGAVVASNATGATAPVFVVMPSVAGGWLANDVPATAYAQEFSQNFANFKDTSNAYPRISVDIQNFRILMGAGTQAPTALVGFGSTYFTVSADNTGGAAYGLQLGVGGEKIAFFGGTPILQPSRVGQLTSGAGTGGGGTTDVGASFSQSTLNNNFATLVAQVNALEALIHNLRLSA